MTAIPTPRFKLAVFVVIVLHGSHSIAIAAAASAADQEVGRRHNLIHRPAVESPAPPATTQGTVLQAPSAQSTRITTPIRSSKTAVAPTPVPLTHHRTLTKRPATSSTTAPATSSQTLRAAPTSSVAVGQVTQTTANTTKGTALTTPAPVTKPTAAALPGAASAGSSVVALASPAPFAGAAGVRSGASAGSGSALSSSGSRSALNLLQNPAIASLLQPPTPLVTTPPSPTPPSTPVVTTPPSPAPPSTPPSIPPSSSPSTGTVTLTWTANGEPDLAGYKIYVGTASGTYNGPGSPFVSGKVASCTVSNLPKGQTYFFAMSAYDNAGNESQLSAEISKSLF